MKKNSILLSLLLFVILFIYLITLKGIGGNIYPQEIVKNKPPFETSMERGRYAQIVALAEHNTFNVNKFYDFLTPDLAWYNGNYYSAFPPGVAIIAVPFYLLGEFFNLNQLFSSLVSVFFTIATVLVMYLIGKKLKIKSNFIFTSMIIFALASNAWSYSVSLSAHTSSAFFITLSYFIAINIYSKNPKNTLLFVSLWITFLINLFIDYPNLFIILPSIIYSIWQVFGLKQTDNETKFSINLVPFWTFLIATPLLLLFVVYNLNLYGKPFAFTNTYNLKRLEIQNIKYTHETLSNDLFEKKSYSQRFNIGRVLYGAYILLISPDRGLLFYFPIYIFSFISILIAIFSKNRFIILAFVIFIFDLFIYGAFDDPYGGWGFGPRYLIPVLPLLSIIMFYYLQEYLIKKILGKAIVLILLFFSIFTSLCGAFTTNAVPPKVEAVVLNMKYNFLYNFDLILNGNISSYFYKTYLSFYLSPILFFSFLLIFTYILTTFYFFQKSELKNEN